MMLTMRIFAAARGGSAPGVHGHARGYLMVTVVIGGVWTSLNALLGHLVRGITNLNRVADRLDIHGEPVVLLEHMLLSHHGEAEFGSPRAPMFPEAEALHWLDMMDARMNTMKTAAEKTPEGAFSEKIYSLDRRIYHPKYTEDAE